MADNKLLFEEKQYMGLNKFSIIRRAVFAAFCLTIYFTSETSNRINVHQQTENLLLVIAGVIILFSFVLLFILHLHTKVSEESIELDGFWTTRKVKIPLSHITEIKQIKYSRYLLNRAVYNLHVRGKIKFYTRGNEAIQLTDKDGLLYVIGSQHCDELEVAIRNQLNRMNS
ncbi:MAG: hypothetical protein CL843_02095 [Crocinitomicaceae bacterium]|nr:hypothetical protein [Crocinitomicaceae bacterium]|tara:strand:- start:9727 stop:10239 length:513 start_codon:yes stop_codon:yes gene_type:complete